MTKTEASRICKEVTSKSFGFRPEACDRLIPGSVAPFCDSPTWTALVNRVLTFKFLSKTKLFETSRDHITSQFKIPVLLPADFPKIFAEKIKSVKASTGVESYKVSLWFARGYGDAGFAGYISGDSKEKIPNNWKTIPLTGGVTGYFKGRVCGGTCNSPEIRWSLENVVYTLQLKLIEIDDLKVIETLSEIANSAIQNKRTTPSYK